MYKVEMIFDFEVKKFLDKEGNPTCAKNFLTGEVCVFYRTQRFGCNETCIFADYTRKYLTSLERRTSEGVEGEGSLIPGDFCPLHK